MTEIKERSCFIHVDVPGHADNADALPENFPFPSLQALGEDLVTILDYLHVKYVIGLGEGAGANVLARFGLAHPTRALGLILINATGSAASVLQSFKSKVNNKGSKGISDRIYCILNFIFCSSLAGKAMRWLNLPRVF